MNIRIYTISILLITVFVNCNTGRRINEIPKNSKPNILIILLDDAGYNDFGFMGCEDLKTPEIDKLASNGIVFTDAHVSATVCGPSRAGLITGRYQQRFGFECNPSGHNYGVDTSEIMLSDALKKAGYVTAAIGKWHLGHKEQYHPNNRGFDYFYGFLAGGRSYFPDEKVDKPGNARAILENNTQVNFTGYLTDVLGEKAIDFIDTNKDSTFFMYLAYNAVHTPMHATESDLELFENHPRQTLAAMTWALDRSIGNVVQKLKDEGIYDNTLIFFLSDNGGAHNNQSKNTPLKGYKGNQFEGGHRVPFFLTWGNKFINANNYNGLTTSLDIFATCVDVASCNKAELNNLDGVSLLPYLSQDVSGEPHETLFWRKSNMSAVRQNDLKLLYVEHLGHRLYDVKVDLSETEDLVEIKPEDYRSLQNTFSKWEGEMLEPLWVEGEVWDSISTLINTDLYNNELPKLKDDKVFAKTKRQIVKSIKNKQK